MSHSLDSRLRGNDGIKDFRSPRLSKETLITIGSMRDSPSSVIPAQAGIQAIYSGTISLLTAFHPQMNFYEIVVITS